MASFPTATTPNLGDLILVGSNPYTSSGAAAATATPEPGLYIVLNTTAPYTVAPAIAGNPAQAVGLKVPQAVVLAVYRSA